MKLSLKGPAPDVFIPAGTEDGLAERITHLAIVAHQDDLEIAAFHGISECYERSDRGFAGVVCTSGSGAPRSGPYAEYSGEELAECRAKEQRCAARAGRYALLVQLGWPSPVVRGGGIDFESDLQAIFGLLSPRVLYTHNPFDRHTTHAAVAAAVVEAVRRIPAGRRPEQFFGCEGWGSLDWLPDNHKVVLDVSRRLELAKELLTNFPSQLGSGKRYDVAAPARWQANATFDRYDRIDQCAAAVFALDLLPFVKDGAPPMFDQLDQIVEEFRNAVHGRLAPERR